MNQENMNETINEVTTKKLVDDLKAVFDDVNDLLKITAGETGKRIVDLRHLVENKLTQCRQQLTEPDGVWRKKADEVKTSTQEYLQEHPWSQFAMAVGIGLLVGALMRRD